MGLDIKSDSEKQYYPVFRQIFEYEEGGCTIASTDIPSTTHELFQGQPLHRNASTTGLFNPVKIAKLKRTLGTSACVTIYVYSADIPGVPGQNFKVGEFVMISGRGSAATIASITIGTKTSGVGTDTIIFTAGGGGLNATAITNTVLIQAANDVTTGAAPIYSAAVLLAESVKTREDDGTTINNLIAGGVVRGTVNESILPVGACDEGFRTELTSRIRFM